VSVGGGEPESEAARWSQLLRRLDDALAEDGRLL